MLFPKDGPPEDIHGPAPIWARSADGRTHARPTARIAASRVRCKLGRNIATKRRIFCMAVGIGVFISVGERYKGETALGKVPRAV